MKNFTSGLMIVAAVVGLWFLFGILRILAVVLMPLLLGVAVLYFLGYYAPKGWHEWAETKIRAALDWLDFKAPAWSWGFIRTARGALDWLGLHVKKTRT